MNVHEQDQEIAGLVSAFLTYADMRAFAIPANDLQFSHPTPNPTPNSTASQTATPTPTFRPHGPKPAYGPGALSPMSDDEVVAQFRYRAAHFLTLHRQHITPEDPASHLSGHLGGSCSHLRDMYRSVLVGQVHHIEAHVNANTPYERLCIACIRQRRNVERYQCTTCGGRNPTRGRFKTHSRSAVQITQVPFPPLTWHVPMCARCRRVISTAYLPQELISAADHAHAKEVSSA